MCVCVMKLKTTVVSFEALSSKLFMSPAAALIPFYGYQGDLL